MLAPHDAEHRELEVVRVAAAEPVADGVELVVGHAETAMERLDGSLGHGHRDPAAAACRLVGGARRALDERADDPEPVVGAEDRLGRPFRVRHQARDVAAGVHDPGDRPERAVRVRGSSAAVPSVDVAEQDLAVALERVERRVVRVVAALAVRDRHAQRSARRERVRERRVEPLGGDRDLLAGEPERRVPQQRARHEPGLGEDLEPVADAEDEPAVGGEGTRPRA